MMSVVWNASWGVAKTKWEEIKESEILSQWYHPFWQYIYRHCTSPTKDEEEWIKLGTDNVTMHAYFNCKSWETFVGDFSSATIP
jgi:hypothetical protein